MVESQKDNTLMQNDNSWTQKQMDKTLAQAWNSQVGHSSGSDDGVATRIPDSDENSPRGGSKESQEDSDSDFGSEAGEADDLQHAPSEVRRQSIRNPSEPNARVLYDKCTLRTWFMAMDTSGDGSVSKHEFINWLIRHPEFRRILVKGEGDGRDSEMTNAEEKNNYALLARRMLKFFREIDVDKSGSINFKEFTSLFRRAGYLLEYSDQDNPRDAAAKMLKQQSGTGPVQDVGATSQRVRRGSECLWYWSKSADVKEEIAVSSRAQTRAGQARRHSASCVLDNSPASFWENDLVLGNGSRENNKIQKRRRSWGGGTRGTQDFQRPHSTMPNF